MKGEKLFSLSERVVLDEVEGNGVVGEESRGEIIGEGKEDVAEEEEGGRGEEEEFISKNKLIKMNKNVSPLYSLINSSILSDSRKKRMESLINKFLRYLLF